MKKILALTLISSVTLILTTGCGGSGPSAKSPLKDPSVNENALYINTQNNDKIAKSIHTAGQQAGWRVTDFNSNALIAEKIDGDTSYTTTVEFHNGHIEFNNEDGTSDSDISDLKDAIEKALKENSQE